MGLQSRLDRLVNDRKRREALLEAVRAGRIEGVAPAEQHFQSASSSESEAAHISNFNDLGEPEVEECRGARVLVFRRELELEGENPAEQPWRIPVPRPGILLATDQLDHIARGSAGVDPCRIAFLDTETSGLSGGSGTVAFLIGVGRLVRNEAGVLSRFVLEQFLIEDYCHEPAQIEAVCERLEDAEAFCTYNGRGFDIPVLRTRGILNRVKPVVWRKPNLDLLPMARRLWREDLQRVNLTRVESEVLGITRDSDVPGSEVPGIWLDYARTSRLGRMPLVVHHNAQDIASLVSLLALQMRFLANPEEPGLATRPGELRGMARLQERLRNLDLACRLHEQAIGMALRDEAEERHLMHLARLYKRQRRWDEAVSLWRGIQQRPLRVSMPAWIELAKYLEHRERQYREARLLVHQCLRQWELEEDVRRLTGRVTTITEGESWLADLRKRLDRLDRKLAKAATA